MKRWYNKKGKLNHVAYFGIACLTVVISFTVLLITGEETQFRLTKEDGFFESVGSIGWLIASIVFLYVFWKNESGNNLILLRTKRNLVFCILGIFCFVACGEEISWGQRIFGIQTPEFLKKINRQGETNLHNIVFIQSQNSDNANPSFWARTLTSTRLFQAFWLGYCILLPLASIFCRKANYHIKNINIPLVPIWLSAVFLANYLISRAIPLIYSTGGYSNEHYFVEVKECNFGILFMLVSFYFLQSTVNDDTVYRLATHSLYELAGRLELAKEQLPVEAAADDVL